MIRYCIIIPIPKPSCKWIDCEQTSNDVHYVCFYVSCFLGNLVKEGMCEFLGLGHNRSIDLACLSQIFFGVVVKRKSPHGQPNNLITILCYFLHQFSIPSVKIIFAKHVVHMSRYITFSCSSIHITYHQFIIITVQINFSINCETLESICDLIHSKIQSKFIDLFISQMSGQNVSFFVEVEGNSRSQFIIDDNLNLRIFMGGVVRTKANQKWTGFVCAILVFNYNGVTNSLHNCVIVEGAAEDLSGLHARLKQKHLFVFQKGIIFYLSII